MTDSIDTGPLDGLFDHVDWKESAAFGVGAWVVGLLVSYVIVTLSELMETPWMGQESTTDVATAFYYEGIGGVLEIDGLEPTILVYGELDSNFWGAAVALHYISPLIVLTIVGYVLAGRYAGGKIDGVDDPTNFQVAVGAASLAVGFAAAMVVGMSVFGGDAFGGDVSYDTGQLLVVSLLYPAVFASFGAGIRLSVRTVTSGRGLLFGMAAALVGTGLWYVIEDPLDPRSIGDLSGTTEHFEFLTEYFGANHAMEHGDVIPEWYVIVGVVAVTAGLVYWLDTKDWRTGLGQGAQIGIGYFLVALIVALTFSASVINDEYDAGHDRAHLVDSANLFFGYMTPSMTIVGAIVWAVTLGAVGGVIGAKIVESRTEEAPTETGAVGGDPAE